MLNLILSLYSTILGYMTGPWQSALIAAITTIRDMFRVQYSYWHGVSGKVMRAWSGLTRQTLIEREAVSMFMDAVYRVLAKIQKAEVPWLANWIAWLGGKIRDEIHNVVKMLLAKMQQDYNANHNYTTSVLKWIIVHVFLFLLKILTNVVSWIVARGDIMWSYFSDVIKFGEFLIHGIAVAIEKHAWDLAAMLGKFFLSLIIRNVVKFATLIESIVSAVL